MPKFVKKPVTIEAVRVADVLEAAAIRNEPVRPGESGAAWKQRVDAKWLALPEWVRRAWDTAPTRLSCGDAIEDTLLIVTPNGMVTAELDEWLLRGVHGELYPCRPDIFEETYMPAEKAETLSDLLTRLRDVGPDRIQPTTVREYRNAWMVAGCPGLES